MLELSKEKVLKNLRTFVVDLKHPMKSNYFREGVLIKGDYGWAEFAPFANHSIEHSTRWLQSAIEMAWTDLVKPETNQIEVNALVVSLDFESIKNVILNSGCKTIKIKLSGDNLEKDKTLIQNLKQEFSNLKFRIDFNGSLGLPQAIKYADEFNSFNIEYFEQPCNNLDDLKQLKKKSKIKIAIDESFRLAPDCLDNSLLDQILDIADFLIVKPIPLGGIKRFKQLLAKVREDTKIVISGSMDTSIGLYLTALAQTLIPEQKRLVAGGGTGLMLKTDLVSETIVPQNGFIEVKKLAPNESLIVESSNRDLLINRISDCFDFGRERGWF